MVKSKKRKATAASSSTSASIPQAAAKTDTSQWEKLLAGDSYSTAVTRTPAAAPPPHKKSGAKVPSISHKILTKNVGRPLTMARMTKKGGGGAERRQSEIVRSGSSSGKPGARAKTNPTYHHSSTKRSSVDVHPIGAAASASGGDGKSSKKRKRVHVSNGMSGSTSKQQRKQQDGYSGTSNKKKRQGSNSLNSAFQAQKDEALAAARSGGQVDPRGGGRSGDKPRGSGKGRQGGKEQVLTENEKAQYVALDCEMVGVGSGGCRSALARCCLVDWEGNIIYDKYVTPNERVTDFRTFVSGVKAHHLKGGLRLRQCQEEVAAKLKGKILVGHALHNDLKALMMDHPLRMKRDTATYRPYQKAHGRDGGKLRPKSLKILAREHLDRVIQTGQHSPAEDAKAAMDLYKLARPAWEKSLSAGKMRGRRAVVDQHGV